ncbi:hypothetical protein Aple_100030 [Acrocarpospora pleiomorpha]|uniref:Uncharacterized protein n=1 Tax=Acrocarpospora pleiomorpha TaxID=90975 RepID=A0A5M3Y1D0_9ACTN|nr:hypothetical protein Aple_100030 [Acrocarpospora pleiomorpha]
MSVHVCEVAPVQLCCWTALPADVLASTTPRHLPLWAAARRKPLPCVARVNRWLVPPVQVNWISDALSAVLKLRTSRHWPLLPLTSVYVPGAGAAEAVPWATTATAAASTRPSARVRLRRNTIGFPSES